MRTTARDVLESAAFIRLVSRRWAVSVALLTLLFVIYYGYILAIAWAKPLLARRVGEVTTLGIPLGIAVIVVSWILTAAYVAWANRVYDPEVERLRRQARG